MSVKEIEAAIQQLSVAERSELRAWFDELEDDTWDKQIEDDAKSGRLDKWLDKVRKDYETGLAKPFEEARKEYGDGQTKPLE